MRETKPTAVLPNRGLSVVKRRLRKMFRIRLHKVVIDPADGVRHLLQGQCTLCADSLVGHVAAMVASFALTDDSMVPDLRAQVASDRPSQLPSDPAPNSDALQYFILKCPRTGRAQLIEVVSRLGLYEQDVVWPLGSVSAERLAILCGLAKEWMPLG
ncbi:MAG TPA: hypothetical protein VN541_23800 [Tepidisphaeraceae bacterium]|nr:hypothetical protein [Tepidisphaeraceae bacterium]